MDFYDIEELDTFIRDKLQPNMQFLTLVDNAIYLMCFFLKRNCFAGKCGCRVLKIVTGGSLGRGTALKGRSDADLVVFLSCFKGYKDEEEKREKIIKEIQHQLEMFTKEQEIDVLFEKRKWDNPRVLSFWLRANDSTEYIEFDVLPAFNALGDYNGSRPDPQVYIDLINSGNECEGQFSPCFTELQRDFIKNRCTKLKNLIRMVKYWYKKLPLTQSLPPKYALELLTVYAWEQGSKECRFSAARGFRTVLWLIEQYKELCIFWTKNYDFQNTTLKQYLQRQLRKARPIILDPADPTGIVGMGSRWDILAQHATKCFSQLCCINPEWYRVKPWDVSPQVTWEEDSFCSIS